MSVKERLHELIDELPDTPEAWRRLEAIERELTEDRPQQRTVEDWLRAWGEPETAPIPEDWGWGRLPSGKPAPNWVAVLDDTRRNR